MGEINFVIKTPGNMVLVFDEQGEQVPEYQGRYEDVKKKIIRDAPPGAIFGHRLNSRGETYLRLRETW